MVARVLVVPPRRGDADDGVGEGAAQARVRGVRGEDLPVQGLVGDEGELREDHAEERGHHELPPGLPDEHEGHPGAEGRGGQDAEDREVEALPSVQEAGLTNRAQQVAVGVRRGDALFGTAGSRGAESSHDSGSHVALSGRNDFSAVWSCGADALSMSVPYGCVGCGHAWTALLVRLDMMSEYARHLACCAGVVQW